MFLVLGGIQFLANAVQVSFTLTLKALIVKLYIDYKFKLFLKLFHKYMFIHELSLTVIARNTFRACYIANLVDWVPQVSLLLNIKMTMSVSCF